MGLRFDSATTNGDHLRSSDDPVTGYPCSMFFWFRYRDSEACRGIQYTDTSTGTSYVTLYTVSGSVRAGSRNAAAQRTSVTSTSATTDDGIWHSAIGVFASSTSRTAWLDNGGDVENTDTSTFPSAADRIAVGAFRDSTPAYGDGDLAEIACWDGYALTADDRAALHAGLSPMMIKPSALTLYAPLQRDSRMWVGGTWNQNDAFTSVQNHPKIIYPSNAIYINATAAAVGGSTPKGPLGHPLRGAFGGPV